ncbi:SdrD B-like domain-containing protein [Stieleria marina]|uniref:SdrD B-like domain-containing protein n=1 Tax=Stieleria marina TaxID=1930275 RepID=UPI003AF3E610
MESRRVLAGPGPDALSIVRADANPTNDAQVAFDVTFDESVSGVDATDFAIAASGPTGATVSGVSGSGSTYQIVVSTGSGDGSVRLDLIDNDSIVNGQNKSLGGNGTTGNQDGSFTTGESYTIDKTVPTTSGATLVGTPSALDAVVDFNITFSESVGTIDASDFVLAGTASATASIQSVSGSNSSYVISVNTGSGQGDLRVDFIDDDTIVDVAGNAIDGVGNQTITGQSHSVDHVAPTIVSFVGDPTSPTNASLVDYTVTFDEPVVNVGLSDFALTASGVTGAMLSNISGSGMSYVLSVNTGTGDGSVELAVSPTATIDDTAGNPMAASSATSGVTVIDRTRPTVSSITVTPSITNAATAVFDVLFTEAVVGFDAGDLTLSTAGLSDVLITQVTGAGASYQVEISTGTGDGTIGMTIESDQGIFDLAGNERVTGAGFGPLTVDKTAPTVTSVTPVDSDPVNSSTVYFDVLFSESTNSYTSADFSIVSSGLTGTSIAWVAYQSTNVRRVAVNTGTGSGTVSIDVNSGQGVQDAAGNLLASGLTGNPAVTIDREMPSIVSMSRLDPTQSNLATVQYAVTFDEPVMNVDSADFELLATGGLSGHSITGISGTSTDYTIDVATGTGDGTLQLEVSPTASIDDLAGNSLNTSAANAEIYLIDKTAPTIVSVDRVHPTVTTGDSIQYQVTYSEPVLNIDASDFTVFTSPASSPPPPISSLVVTGNMATITVDVSSYEGGVYMYASSNDLTDAAGNSMASQVVSSQQFYVDRTPPTVSSVLLEQSVTNSLTNVSFLVTFSELVNGYHPSDVEIDQVGFPSATVSSVDYVNSTQRRVNVYTGPGQGTLSIVILANQTIRDLANQYIAVDSGNHPDYSIDNVAPQVQSITLADADPITTATFSFDVVFSEPVTGVTSSAFALSASGAVVPQIDSVTGDGDTYTVTVTNTGDTGAVQLSLIDDDSIQDALLNPLGGTGNNNGDFDSPTYGVGTTGRIAGRVIDDLDRDGFADAGETGVVGVTVYVDANDNAVWDIGEPSAVTIADDTGTVGVDESGNYLILDVDPGSDHAVRVIPPVGWLATNPATRAAGTGLLTEVQLLRDNIDGNNALEEVAGVTESPDGEFVYIAAYTDNAITAYARNSTTGQLTRIQTVLDGSGGVDGLIGAQSIAISPDGAHLYVASALDDALVMFSRDQATGLLTYLGHLKQGVGGVDGLNEATAIRESADGKHLYVAAVTSGSLAVFDRDPATGLVTFAQKLTGSTGGSFSVDLSPDQRHVYLTSGNSNAFHVYDRDLTTGLLTLSQTVTQSTPGYASLNQPWGVSVSPDGQNIYVATRLSQGVIVLDRDSATGHVSYNQFVPDPYTTSNPDPVSVLVSPDGHHVAVTYQTAGGLAIYARDQTTGALTLVESFKNNVGGFDHLFGAWDVEFSNDGESLYVVAAYDDAVYAFSRDMGDWVPTAISTSVSVGETTTLGAFGISNLVPMVDSIAYSGTGIVTGSTVDFDILFSEPVSGVDASDFLFLGSYSGATVASVNGSGDTYTLTVNLADGSQGTLSPRVSFSGGIVDNEGTPLGGDGSTVFDTIDVDRLAPTLVSSAKLDVDPTNQTSLDYQLVFSEPVTGLDVTDFAVAASGVTGAAVASVTGSDDTYVVAVSHTGGEGTIGLVFADNDSVVDDAGFPLDGVGTATNPLAAYNVQLGSIQGTVFSDLDSDGVLDAGEPGAGAMTVYIDSNNNGTFDTGELTAVTATGTGFYEFTGLVDGNYALRLQGQSPYVQTLPIADGPQLVTVAVANGIALANFGTHEVLPGNIAGNVWNDVNNNGELDAGESGLPGVTLYVDLNLNGAFDSATEPSVVSQTDDGATGGVDETGDYLFTGLAPGDYEIRIVEPQYSLSAASSSWNANQSIAISDSVNLAADNKSITKSPNGKFAVVFDHLRNNVIVYELPVSGVGPITQVQVLTNQFSDTTNKSGDLGFTPDGAFLFVLEHQTRQVKGYSQDPTTGLLTLVSSATVPLGYNYSLQVSPDGSHLYVGGINGISRLSINSNGTLSSASTTSIGARFSDLVFNDDGTRLYAVDSGNVRIRVFSRNTTTGSLSQIEEIGAPAGLSFSGNFSAELSDNGNDFYIVSWAQHTIFHYRTQADGTLQFADHVTIGDTINRTYPLDMTISEDGTRVYAAMSLSGAIMVLERDLVTGTLTPGATIGTPDPAGLGINESSSSMIIIVGPTSVLRVNSRDTSLQLGVLGNTDWLDVTVNEDQTTNLGVPVDAAPPTVTSITTSQTYISGTDTANFVLQFSEPVTGVDVTDFSLALSGVTGASITSVTDLGSGAVYGVTVDSGTGDGTLQLLLVDDDSIIDAGSNPLAGTGTGNGDAVSAVLPVERIVNRTISGTVFNDLDNDGVRDTGEDGADGSQIYIDLNGNGELDTISEPYDWYVSGGTFTFDNLTPGTYTLRVTDRLYFVESAFSTTTVELGFNDNPLVVDVPATENQSAFVGVVFEDLNANGVRDAGEPGIPGETMYWDDNNNGLFETGDTFVVTAADDSGTPEDEAGTYSLSPLWYRQYVIRVDRGSEWLATSAESASATIAHHTQTVPADFGLQANLTSISGVVFDDVDADGVQSTGENPVSGWTVFLDADNDGVLDTGETSHTTDATGAYSFDQLSLVTHYVRIVPQADFVSTSPESTLVTIATNADTATVDFATHVNATTISGSMFDDSNANGIADTGEGPLVGATVYLDANDNGRLDTGEVTTTTDAAGLYTFTDVQPGEAVVRILPPVGFEQSSPSTPTDRLFVWHGSNKLREINPTDGSTIADYWQSSYPTTSITADGLAFDGTSLWAIDNGQKKIFQIDPDAITIESQIDVSSLGPSTYSVAWNGLATVGSTIYLSGAGGEIGMVDATTGSLIGTSSLFTTNSGSPFLSGVNETTGLGASADGQSLIVATDNDSLLTFDPSTLLISDSDPTIANSQLAGVGSVGGSTYVSRFNSSLLQVHDSTGTLTGALSIGCQAVAVAGGLYQDLAARLTVGLDQQITGVQFGAAQFAGTISGVEFIDTNNSGVQDAGELPAVGVTVFADINDNGSRDGSEPFDISAADGTYSIAGVPLGSVVVRSTSTGHRPSDAYTPQDFLFGLRNQSGSIRIDRLDPANGSITNSLFTTVPYNNGAISMAFDGERLVLIDGSIDMLYQVGLDGSIISSRHLGEPYIDSSSGQTAYTSVQDYGAAVVGGTIYTVRQEFGGLTLYTYDPLSDQFAKARPITFDWGLSSMPSAYTPTTPSANFGVGVSADEQRILVATDDDRVLEIDPVTGVATFDPAPSSSNGTDYAIDSLGGETFISYGGRIEVVDSSGTTLRNMTGIPTYLGLAAGTQRDNGQSVTVLAGQTITVNHGVIETLATISGTVITDVEENGVVDPGDPVVVGATVFLDLDRNGILDGGEPSTTTDVNGDYSFEHVAAGEYSLRVLTSSGVTARALTEDRVRLFQAIRGTDDIVVIQEIDPITGDQLNQFDAPLPTATSIGLAAKGNRIYYSRSGGIDVLDAADGTLLDSIVISNGTKDGMAIIGDRAYVQDYNSNTIEVVDLVTRQIVGTLDIGDANGTGPNSFPISYSLAEAPDGVNLALVPQSGGDVFIVEPNTGVIVETLFDIYAGYGSTSAGGEYFERGWVSSGVQTTITARDSLGLIRRQIPLSYQGYVFGLGATSVPASDHIVTVFAEKSLAGTDFGLVPENATVTGTQFVDANGNDVQDAGESGLQGVTVYVDLNGNGWVDAGEPNTTSAADGTYSLANVPRGSQWIRTVASGYESSATLGTTDRLLGTTRVSDASSPTQYVLQIRELDPVSGFPIRYTNTSVPVLSAYSSAVVNDRIIVVDNLQDKIFQVALDGTLIGEAPLPSSGTSFAYAQGPAVIDGTVYVVMTGGGSSLRLERFDLETNQFYGSMPISADVSQSPSVETMPQISESVAESPDGKSIVLFSHVDDRAFIVDPLTARVTEVVNLVDSFGGVWSAATLGGELYIRGSGSSSNLRVYDASYSLVRTAGNPATGGMAGVTENMVGVVVDASSSVSAIDMGQQAIHTNVSGIVSYDTNVNGLVDPGEETVGATVYLDANRNGVLDTGELTTTTLADGSYSFTQLAPGDYSVAVVRSTTDRVVTSESETALYALEVSGGVSMIRKHDPITGQTLRQFSPPGTSTDSAGLAVDDYGLYYSTFEGVWVLNYDTGDVKDFFDLPSASSDGLAVVAGRLFVLQSDTDLILSIDPRTGTLLDTFDINAINNTSYNLAGNLGESTDGENLIARLPSGGGLVINPDTGVIENWYAYNYGSWAIAGADGELYRSNGGTTIRVESESEQQIRLVPVGYEPRAIAAAVIPAAGYDLRAADKIHFPGRDFQLAPADQFPTTTISGTVWSDDNRDGQRDASEAGIAGATVYVDLNQNGFLDAGDLTEITVADDLATAGIDEAGNYAFTGLTPGYYDVRQVLLPSSIGTSPYNPVLTYDARYDTDASIPTQFEPHPLDDLRVSATGRYVAYSTTRQMVPSDTNTTRDVYLLDRVTDQHELISVNTAGVAANNNSLEPDVSSNGRYVVFRTWATNLDAGDTDNFLDVYVRDRVLGTTTLLTKGGNGGPGNGNSRDAIITPDGRFVVLTSWGDQLVPGDTNGWADTFLFDLQSNSVTRVSTTDSGMQLTDASSWGADITPDGQYVVFETVSSQLAGGFTTANDTNGVSDLFVKNMTTGQVEVVSASATGTLGNSVSSKRSISDDGRWVAFESSASNLTLDPHAGPGAAFYVYLKDMQTGDIKRISNTAVTGSYEGNSRRPEISGDGRFVVFESDGQLVAADTNSSVDIYLYDRITDKLTLVSQGDNGVLSRNASNNAVISADGSTIAFTTISSNILGTNNVGGIVTVDVDRLLGAHTVQLSNITPSIGNDFGQIAVTSSFAGTLWQDDNGDGVIDAGETRLPGRTIFIDTNEDGVFTAGEPSQVTLADDPATPTINEAGTYEFAGLADGQYTVLQVLPANWTQTSPLQSAGLELLADTEYIHGVNNTTQPIYDSASSDYGRFIAFSTNKSMLPIDTNSGSDLYVLDRDTGLLDLVSQSSSGVLANGVNRNVSISGDGRYVAFRSFASNLSAADNNGTWDIYVRDRLLGTTTLVSAHDSGQGQSLQVGNSYSYNPQISQDGSVVTFWSNSNNLIAGDVNGQFDVFLKDLQTGTVEIISVDSSGNQATGGDSHASLPSNDGQLVGFWSGASNLVPGDTNNVRDVFLRDRQKGVTERVSVSETGEQANGATNLFSMSDDGRYFALMSSATNLTSDAGLSGNRQIYLKDRLTGSVTLVSRGDGTLPNGVSLYPSISSDGRWISYQSSATNIVPGDTNGADDVFLYDTINGTTTMLSENVGGVASDGPSDWPRMSRDGSTITFNSAASDLVDQPPSSGGLYAYSTPSSVPGSLEIDLGIEQTLVGQNLGSQVMVDRSDAPLTFGTPTHALGSDVRLGSEASFDLIAGQPSSDNDGVVTTSGIVAGFDATFDVTSSTAGTLAAWIDFNGDGDFDPEERSQFSIGTVDQVTTDSITIAIPTSAISGNQWARFRFSTDSASVQSPTGPAVDGEVEDYSFVIAAPVAPSSIDLSSSSINENTDTSAADLLFAQLSAVDQDPGDSHSFQLVAGTGDTDNSRFVIVGNELKLRQGEVIDYENQSTYLVRIRATDSVGLEVEQEISLNVNNLVEISKSDITIGDGSSQRSRIDSVTIQFDTDVILQPGAITVYQRGSSGGEVGTVISPIDGTAAGTFTLTFNGAFTQFGSLADGNYEIRVDASKVVSIDGFFLDTNQDGIQDSSTGDNFTFGDTANDNFFRHYGDTNGDRSVGIPDYGKFRLAFGKSLGDAGFDPSLDYNNDGAIGIPDYGQFRIRFGKSVSFE